MQPFAYYAPVSTKEAIELLVEPGARALAGGTDLIPQIREARRKAGVLVDLKHIPELVRVEELPDGAVHLGAAANATAIARNESVQTNFAAVAEAAAMIGSWQIQNRATLGGNVCNAAPSADAIPPLLVHDAEAILMNASGGRHLPLTELFAGPGRTHLTHGEYLATIALPAPEPQTASHYMRFTPRREMDIAVAGVAAAVTINQAGIVTKARMALASVAPTPIRATSGEALLKGNRLDDETIQAAACAAREDAKPISDTRGSADYRRELVAVLARRVLDRCRSDLTGGEL